MSGTTTLLQLGGYVALLPLGHAHGQLTRCVDASALVKNYVKEDFSDESSYLRDHPDWYTTLFTFFEALTVLKVKCISHKSGQLMRYKDGST